MEFHGNLHDVLDAVQVDFPQICAELYLERFSVLFSICITV